MALQTCANQTRDREGTLPTSGFLFSVASFQVVFANSERLNLLGSGLREPDVTEDEIEVVAEELAKAGGLSWYPGRQHGSLLRVVSDRYRDRARLAIAALDRCRMPDAGAASSGSTDTELLPMPVREAI